nr:integrase, catalytic region, zinc finger, CCHC-type, peptidase aspartic, catalytic [Tanacetum cinerariifolium]
MTTPTVTSSTDSQMHNNIMVAGSRDRPLMLATGRYPKWRSRFLRYIDTRPNGDALRKCILRDTNEEIDEQELEVQNNVGYNVFANDLQHSEQSESISSTCLVETDDSSVIPDSSNMCDDDERVALANLIANLKLDVDENKKIQKQFKKANTTLAQINRPSLRSIRPLMTVPLTMTNLNIIQLIIFIVDSGCTTHMTGNLKLLRNFVEKFLGTVRFGNDQFAPIMGYGYLIQGNITINRVYYVEGLNHNLFSVG